MHTNHTGKMLIFPQSNYQTRERRGETGKRAVLQSQGASHYCPGAAVVHSQVSCVTKMDFSSRFPWFNTLQNWSHILVFSGIVALKDILTSALSGAQTNLHIAATPLDAKRENAYKRISPTPGAHQAPWGLVILKFLCGIQ